MSSLDPMHKEMIKSPLGRNQQFRSGWSACARRGSHACPHRSHCHALPRRRRCRRVRSPNCSSSMLFCAHQRPHHRAGLARPQAATPHRPRCRCHPPWPICAPAHAGRAHPRRPRRDEYRCHPPWPACASAHADPACPRWPCRHADPARLHLRPRLVLSCWRCLARPPPRALAAAAALVCLPLRALVCASALGCRSCSSAHCHVRSPARRHTRSRVGRNLVVTCFCSGVACLCIHLRASCLCFGWSCFGW
jgi:hypothetical protein